MALNKTVQYIPFRETSFGFGAGEIASAYSSSFPNATDIVKVVMEISGQWGTTGHISTPEVGTAVANYNKQQNAWVVRGERDDVDAVLAQLKFFPADYEPARTWTPTALKSNQTTGLYANEEPPVIADTICGINVYDENDALVPSGSNILTWEADGPTYGNQRPYWSVEPTSQDASGVSYDTVAGGLLDFGTISHGLDTDNVQVKCEFRNWGSDLTYTGSAYGVMTLDTSFYIGDKKPATRNTSDSRFNFTGTLDEAQAFLDNVRYYSSNNNSIFDMFLTITDGAVGSTLTKTIWFADAAFAISDMAPLSGVEEQILWLNSAISALTIVSQPLEVNEWQAEIIIDATGLNEIKNVLGGTLVGNTITYTASSFALLKDAMIDLGFEFYDDMHDAFTFELKVTGSNSTVGSSYTHSQIVNVSITDTSEISNLTTSHSYTEDTRYYFGGNIANIAHTFNDDFTVVIAPSDPSAVEIIWSPIGTNGVDFEFVGPNQEFTITGDRDTVNQILNAMYFEPTTDYDGSFTFSYYQTRTSGDATGWYNTPIGSDTAMIMTGIGHNEYSATLPIIQWYEDMSKIFDSGVRVTDLSDEHDWSPSYGTTYTVRARLRDALTDAPVTEAWLETMDPGSLTISGNGQVGNELIMSGAKTEINAALTALKFIPFPDYINQTYVEYEIERDFDTTIIGQYDDIFTDLYGNAEQNYTWTSPAAGGLITSTVEDEQRYFDTGIVITDNAVFNSDIPWMTDGYTVKVTAYWYDSSFVEHEENNIAITAPTASSHGAFSWGEGTVANPLFIDGSQAAINQILTELYYSPRSRDWLGETDSWNPNINFYAYVEIKRNADNQVLTNQYDPWIAFGAPQDVAEYYATVSGLTTYEEDAFGTYIFAGANVGIIDNAQSTDVFTGDATGHTVTLSLNPTTVGHFGNGQTSIVFNGTKDTINADLQNVQFWANADVNDPVDIIYRQERIVNGSLDVVQADDVTIASLTAIPQPEVTMGTANSNIQYFVQDEFMLGLDLTQPRAVILNNNAYTTLVPKVLTRNLGLSYERPFTVNDTYNDEGGESQYRVIVTGSNLPAGATLAATDSGWLSKTNLHIAFDNGIPVVGVNAANANIPAHNSTFTVNFEIHRKTFNGVETVIYTDSVTYKFLTGIEVWGYNGQTSGLNVLERIIPGPDYYMTWTTQTATKDDGPFPAESVSRVLYFYGSNKEQLDPTTDITFYPGYNSGGLGWDYIYRFNHEQVTADKTQWIFTATYTDTTWETEMFGIRAWTPWGTELYQVGNGNPPYNIVLKHNV